MSDTPETDAAAERNIYGVPCKVDVEFSRKLERERDEARAIAKYWQEQFGHSNTEHEWQSLPWEDGK